MVTYYIFLTIASMFFLILIMSIMSVAEAKHREKLASQIEQDTAISLDEVNYALDQHIMASATMVVGAIAGVVLALIFFNSYQSYESNKPLFGQWLEQTYQVTVDYEYADRWECYLDMLHYPKQNSSSTVPHPHIIVCDTATFEQKKQLLGLVMADVKLLLWAIGALLGFKAFVIGLVWRRWFTLPRLACAKKHARVKWF